MKKFINWIKSIFGLNKKEPQILLSENSIQVEEYETQKRIQKKIAYSNDKIKQINDIVILSKNTIYQEKFEKVLELTQKIHNKIIDDEKVPKIKLEQLHTYFTDEFLNTYNEALDSLKTNSNSVSNKNELDEPNLTFIEKANKLLENAKIARGTILLDDRYNEKRDDYGTYGQKYCQYLINFFNLEKNIIFIGEFYNIDYIKFPILFNLNSKSLFYIDTQTEILFFLGQIK
jgi:hypothetical protein